MNKAYDRINWENYPSDETPINESNLNKIDSATDTLDNRIISLDNTKATKTEVATLVQDVTFEEKTGIITIVKKNGSKVTIDTQMEKIAINFSYDVNTQKIILTLIDGTKQYIDLAALITQYEFLDTDTIAFSINSSGKVEAIVKEGSIKEKHLQPNYLADIKVEVAKAQASSTSASNSAKEAKTSETNAKASQNAAQTSATNANNYAIKSQSYAVGNTGSRTDENTDNAKYYNQQASNSKTSALNSATNASNSATSASSSASKAESSATSASSSASKAESSATSASNSASKAESSATSASSSASKAESSATSASSSASKAESSATTATNKATLASNSAQNASTSEANAKKYYEQTKSISNTVAGAVTGVKGNAETTYRTGGVNLTPANIGAVSIEDFNNLKIGGRNLVRNGDFAQGNGVFSSCWTNWGLPSAREYVTLNGKKWCHIKGTGTALHQGISQNTGILIEKNTQYTISARVKGSKDNQTFTLGIHWLIDKTISAQNWKDFIVNATDTLINVTFTSPNSDINTFNLMLGVSNTTTVYEVYFTDIKLEKGNKITAYSPAYEDYLPLNGGTVNGDIVPDKDETYDLGHEDKKWDNIWAHTLEVDYVNAKDGIRGNLTGNADTATKAVKDSAGDNIITSYRKRMGSVPNNDFNNATVEGVYTYGSSTGIANSYTNGGIWGILEVFNNGYNSTQGVAGTVIHQIAFTTNNQIYFRQRINAWDWTPWKELTSKFSNGEIKVTNPAYSKGYVRAWVDSKGGNLEIQSPDGSTTYKIDAYSNDIIRIFSSNSDGSHKFLKFNGKTGVLSADGGFAGNASTVNGHTVNADVPANAKFTDNNTTYGAGTGIGLSNTTFYNTGVRSIATGSTNGSVAVNTNGTVADVKVKGLNTLAYASGTWNKLTGTNCTLWYNEVAIYLEISAQNVNLTEYGGTATNKTIVVLPTNVTPTKGVFLGVISALNSAWMPLNKAVMCNINYNSHNLTLRPTEALSNVVLNLTAMFPRSLFTIT